MLLGTATAGDLELVVDEESGNVDVPLVGLSDSCLIPCLKEEGKEGGEGGREGKEGKEGRGGGREGGRNIHVHVQAHTHTHTHTHTRGE